MALETAQLIKDLNPQAPAPQDLKYEGDDHLRLIKSVLRNQFPNLEGPVTASAAALSAVGVSTGEVTGAYVQQNGAYIQLRSTFAPMLEYHRLGQVAYATYVGTDNKYSWGQSNGNGNVFKALASLDAEANLVVLGQLATGNTIFAPNFALQDNGAYYFRMNGAADKRLLRTGDLLVFTGADGNFTWWTRENGDSWSRGDVYAFSDERFKKDWTQLPKNTLNKFAGVKCGTYTRTDTGKRQVGVSAQDMELVLPEAVFNDGTSMGVNYGNAALAMCYLLTERLLKLEDEVRALRAAK